MLIFSPQALAADQSKLGAGADDAIAIASKSPLVQSSFKLLRERAAQIRDRRVREATLDAITNRRTCVMHRANLAGADQTRLVEALVAAGLADSADDANFPGGLRAGIFPPVVDDGGVCPHLPAPFFASAGSLFRAHHSYPGGLVVHETVNDLSFEGIANDYRRVFLSEGANGLPVVGPPLSRSENYPGDRIIDQDIVIAAPIWHDWAKTIVFQWNADGSEFAELNFGGNGKTDAWGAAGNSKTGAHHILGLAETMARGMPPVLVIAQASAHASPSLGNEYKVVNWLRAAAIVARVDPVAQGYLYRDTKGHLRLPPVRDLGQIDLDSAPAQSNLLAEYAMHNLSDADYTYSMPAVGAVEIILAQLAPEYSVDPKATDYNVRFRNPVLSYMSAERLMMLYANSGVPAVQAELDKLAKQRIIPGRRGA